MCDLIAYNRSNLRQYYMYYIKYILCIYIYILPEHFVKFLGNQSISVIRKGETHFSINVPFVDP